MTYTVKLSDSDIKKIEKKGFKKEMFAEKDDFDIKFGKYALKRKEGCIFLIKNGDKYLCKIYNARPGICRKYPFNENSELETCVPPAHK